MLDGAFSFKGRVGRLSFFLGGLATIVIAVLVIIGLRASAASMPRNAVNGGVTAIAVIGLLVAAVWYNLSLHVRRIRDLGWSPFYVVVGYFIVQCVDYVVALKIPEVAVGHQHHTLFGSAFNFAVGIALLFLPGSGDDADHATPRPLRYEPREPRLEPPEPRFPPGAPRRPQAGFGRRGLR